MSFFIFQKPRKFSQNQNKKRYYENHLCYNCCQTFCAETIRTDFLYEIISICIIIFCSFIYLFYFLFHAVVFNVIYKSSLFVPCKVCRKRTNSDHNRESREIFLYISTSKMSTLSYVQSHISFIYLFYSILFSVLKTQ